MVVQNFNPQIDLKLIKNFADGWKFETRESHGPRTQFIFSYTNPNDDAIVESCRVKIGFMLRQKAKGALYEYAMRAFYKDSIGLDAQWANLYSRSQYTIEQLISLVLVWASEKVFAISEFEASDLHMELCNNFDNINKNKIIPIKESKKINMKTVKLHEEFKLYENLWEDASNSRFTEISYNGDAEAAAERSRFPLQFNTTEQMMIELNSQNGYRGWRLVNMIEGNKVVRCLVKLDKDNKILDRAPANIDPDDVKAIADYISKSTAGGGKLTESPSTASEIIRRYEDNVADHIVELEHENAFADAEWFEDGWYVLENVKVDPDYFVLVMDRHVETIQDAEAIISYAFSPAKITNIEDAMTDGGVVTDSTSNEIYIERWVIE